MPYASTIFQVYIWKATRSTWIFKQHLSTFQNISLDQLAWFLFFCPSYALEAIQINWILASLFSCNSSVNRSMLIQTFTHGLTFQFDLGPLSSLQTCLIVTVLRGQPWLPPLHQILTLTDWPALPALTLDLPYHNKLAQGPGLLLEPGYHL